MKTKRAINIEVGQRLRAERERQRYTREALAELVGVSTRFLSMVETGASGVSLEVLKKLCKKLNITTDSVLFGTEDINFTNMNNKLKTLYNLNIEHIGIVEEIIDKYIEGLNL